MEFYKISWFKSDFVWDRLDHNLNFLEKQNYLREPCSCQLFWQGCPTCRQHICTSWKICVYHILIVGKCLWSLKYNHSSSIHFELILVRLHFFNFLSSEATHFALKYNLCCLRISMNHSCYSKLHFSLLAFIIQAVLAKGLCMMISTMIGLGCKYWNLFVCVQDLSDL